MTDQRLTNNKIEIVKASDTDARFVAWTVLTALDLSEDNIARATESCRDDKSMYSWKNSIVAKVGGICVGCLISYDGARYKELRDYTWPQIWGGFATDYLNNIAEETQAGEYYLDSMAILPEYRGNAIGKALIQRAIEIGSQQGYKNFTLIVDIAKPHLKAYYQTIGFTEIGHITFFGHQYTKMKYSL